MKEEKINHISIVVTGRNAIGFVEKCLDSAINQNYPDYEIIFIDAKSSDGTFEKALEYKERFKNIKFIQNETRKYQVENIKLGVEMSPYKSIIVTLDSDDWLPHENVLHRVNKEYVKHNCWISYGCYVEDPYRDVSFHYHEYPFEVRQNKTFRQYKWLASHLRTFRREIFMRIKENDLKDPLTGDYVSMVGDLTIMYCMLEMAGINNSRFIRDILYVYNRTNPLSEANINQQEIDRIEKYIRSLPPYPTLDKLYEDE